MRMLLTSSDGQAIKEVTLFYSVFSCVLFPIFCAVLYFTDGYLYFGRFIFIPVLLLILVIESVKRWVHHSIYEKDFKVVTKKTSATNYAISKKFDLREYFKIFGTVCVGIVCFYIMAILYGASIMGSREETFMFSTLMSMLTILPVCLHIGRPFLKLIILHNQPNNMFQALLYQNFKMALLGAWLGAFVIPLDWDRPWQAWPVPCSFGALLGYTASHYITLVKSFVFGSCSVFFKKKK